MLNDEELAEFRAASDANVFRRGNACALAAARYWALAGGHIDYYIFSESNAGGRRLSYGEYHSDLRWRSVAGTQMLTRTRRRAQLSSSPRS